MSSVAPPTALTSVIRQMPPPSTLMVTSGAPSQYGTAPIMPVPSLPSSRARSQQRTQVAEPVVRTGRGFSPQRQPTPGRQQAGGSLPPAKGTLHLYGTYMRVPSRSPGPPLPSARGVSSAPCESYRRGISSVPEPAYRRVPSVDHALTSARRSQDVMTLPTPLRNWSSMYRSAQQNQSAQGGSMKHVASQPMMRTVSSAGTLPLSTVAPPTTSLARQPSLPPKNSSASPMANYAGRSVTVPPGSSPFGSPNMRAGDVSFGPNLHSAFPPTPTPPGGPPLGRTISSSVANLHKQVSDLEKMVEEEKRAKEEIHQNYQDAMVQLDDHRVKLREVMSQKEHEGNQVQADFKRELAALRKEVQELQADKERLTKEKKQAERKLEDVERQNSMVIEESFMNKSAIASLQRESDRQKREIREAAEKREEALAQQEPLKAQLEELATMHEQHVLALNEKVHHIQEMDRELQHVNELYHQAVKELDGVRRGTQDMVSENEKLESQLRQERSVAAARPGEWLYAQRARQQEDLQVQLAKSQLELNDRKHQISALARQLAEVGPAN
mmetsp:Transcript_69686/g.130041  ORF Transcript_69686/g.130041 Transcript_69686/m.130041 type:complete len:556 (+) Transcript_69686:53-1720(+)